MLANGRDSSTAITGGFIINRHKIPEIVVPDLEGFEVHVINLQCRDKCGQYATAKFVPNMEVPYYRAPKTYCGGPLFPSCGITGWPDCNNLEC
jgi:hypothetical protein